MTRHRLPITKIRPEWTATEKNDCLVSIGEEVYTARALATSWGAENHDSCRQLLRSGDKAHETMDRAALSYEARCKSGERALRKYWEARVCARRKALGR